MENGISENYLCHYAITKRKFPVIIRPLTGSCGSKAYLALLLVLYGEVELNPGPSMMCQDCYEEKGVLCQGDMVLCHSCNELRFPPNDKKAVDYKSQSSGTKRKAKEPMHKGAIDVKKNKIQLRIRISQLRFH